MTCTIPRRSETRSGATYVAEGAGEPLVLIHGVGLRLEAWTAQIEGLSATHRVIALDMPGHGGSAPLPRDAQLPDFVAWLAQALDDLGLERANLAGHSMGALITGGMVAEHPDRLDRVGLLCGVHRRTPEAAAAVRARAEACGTVSATAPGRSLAGSGRTAPTPPIPSSGSGSMRWMPAATRRHTPPSPLATRPMPISGQKSRSPRCS